MADAVDAHLDELIALESLNVGKPTALAEEELPGVSEMLRFIAGAEPNPGHLAVAALQHAGLLGAVITQNVDGLHQAAGARPVVELHGGLDRVICLRCSATSDRDELDARLAATNPELGAGTANPAGDTKPDGDVDLDEADVRGFRLVDCLDCGAGPLERAGRGARGVGGVRR